MIRAQETLQDIHRPTKEHLRLLEFALLHSKAGDVDG